MDVEDAVRLDVKAVAFVVRPADMLFDALSVHLEGVRGVVPLVTILPDVVMLVPFAVLASVLIDERGEGRRPRRCPVAPGQGRAATSDRTPYARQALDVREGLPQAMAVPSHPSRAMQRPLTATTCDLVFDERGKAAVSHGGADDLDPGREATPSGDQHVSHPPDER